MATVRRYFGKYRGTVLNNVDPMLRGRVQAQVPDVMGVLPTTWAEPCLPFAGMQQGMFVVPSIGAGVWIEFEHGDADYPVWTGGWWSAPEVPALALAGPPGVQTIVLQTMGQNTLMISDVPGPTGGFLLKTATGAMIQINDVGIVITNGKGATITMTGPSVDVNGGALTVV